MARAFQMTVVDLKYPIPVICFSFNVGFLAHFLKGDWLKEQEQEEVLNVMLSELDWI